MVLAGCIIGAGAAAPGDRPQPGSDRSGDTGANAAAAGAGDAALEGMTDAELALMLQREEQQAHLLELAGYGEGDYCQTLLVCAVQSSTLSCTTGSGRTCRIMCLPAAVCAQHS